MNPDADSDWEYEYDDTEREDIYFTLDLTTHVPNAIQEKHYAKNGKLIAPAAAEKNALTAAHGEGDLNVIFDHPEANATPAAEAGQLQILDLHSEKPKLAVHTGSQRILLRRAHLPHRHWNRPSC